MMHWGHEMGVGNIKLITDIEQANGNETGFDGVCCECLLTFLDFVN